MKFTIDDAPPGVGSAALNAAIRFIRALPNSKLVTATTIARETGYQLTYISTFARLIPEELCARNGNKKIYGNPKTIAAWRKSKICH